MCLCVYSLYNFLEAKRICHFYCESLSSVVTMTWVITQLVTTGISDTVIAVKDKINLSGDFFLFNFCVQNICRNGHLVARGRFHFIIFR